MAKNVKEFKVFIASPSDLSSERALLADRLNSLSVDVGKKSARFTDWRFEEDMPNIRVNGGSVQRAINEYMRDCDIVIAMFRKKFGKPSDAYPCPTVEEIEEAIVANKPVILYFFKCNDVAGDLSDEELDDLRRINVFKRSYQDKGVYSDVDSIDAVFGRLGTDIKANIESKKLMNSNSPSIVEIEPTIEKGQPSKNWYEDSIADHINEYLSAKHIQYKYMADITFRENCILAQSADTVYTEGTLKAKMTDAREFAFSRKYASYDYSGDIRAKFKDWWKPIEEEIINQVECAAKDQRGVKVLDVGGNNGIELEQLFSGIDTEYDPAISVLDIIDKEDFKPTDFGYEYIQSDMEQDDYPNAFYDIILCLRTIQSRGASRNDVLMQMKKHLAPNGVLIVSIPNGYIDDKSNVTRGLYDHRVKGMHRDRPIILAKKVYSKMCDYGLSDVKIASGKTELFVCGRE